MIFRPLRNNSGAVVFMLCPQRRFNGVLRGFIIGWYVDTTANIKRRAGLLNAVYGGAMV